jgi:hypothetical protein
MLKHDKTEGVADTLTFMEAELVSPSGRISTAMGEPAEASAPSEFSQTVDADKDILANELRQLVTMLTDLDSNCDFDAAQDHLHEMTIASRSLEYFSRMITEKLLPPRQNAAPWKSHQ